MLNTVHRQKGFTLIEMMVAAAAGLIVSAATLAFISAMIGSSAATVSSARLTQELRALSEIVARDIRRARSIDDPIENVGSGCAISTAGCGISVITTPQAGCILYAYEGGVGGNFRSFRLASAGGIGAVFHGRGNAALSCTAGGTQISSNLVDITGFTVDFRQEAAGPPVVLSANQIDITIQGRLVSGDSNVTQTYRTSVYVRSGGA